MKKKETCDLKNAMIKSINFSDLDYSSDDLLEVTLTLRYDWATCVIGGATDVDGSSLAVAGATVGQKSFFSAGGDDE